jgi:hypothetical protein
VLSLVFVLLSDYSQPEISEDRMLGYRFIIIFLLHNPPFHKKIFLSSNFFSLYMQLSLVHTLILQFSWVVHAFSSTKYLEAIHCCITAY